MSTDPRLDCSELYLGLSLTAVIALSVAVSAMVLQMNPMVRWLGHDEITGRIAWAGLALCVFGGATIAVFKAVPSGARSGRTLLIIAETMIVAVLASAVWARSDMTSAPLPLELLELYFSPMAILWTPVVGLASAMAAMARSGRKVRAHPGRLVAALGITGLTVALGIYLSLRAAAVDSHVRVMMGMMFVLLSAPFLAAAPLLFFMERRAPTSSARRGVVR